MQVQGRVPGISRRLRKLQLAGLLAGTSAALRLGGLRGAERLLAVVVPAGRRSAPHDPVPHARRLLADIAAVAAGMPGRPRCLSRALVLDALLRRSSLDAKLRIGVRQHEHFDAHAWVELAGVELGNEHDGMPFVALDGPARK